MSTVDFTFSAITQTGLTVHAVMTGFAGDSRCEIYSDSGKTVLVSQTPLVNNPLDITWVEADFSAPLLAGTEYWVAIYDEDIGNRVVDAGDLSFTTASGSALSKSDDEFATLAGLGYSTGSLADRQYAYLVDQSGVTRSHNDMVLEVGSSVSKGALLGLG